MRRRKRIARALRLVDVTLKLTPTLVRIARDVGRAYRKAWDPPKPPPRSVEMVIRVDAAQARRDLVAAQQALERLRKPAYTARIRRSR